MVTTISMAVALVALLGSAAAGFAQAAEAGRLSATGRAGAARRALRALAAAVVAVAAAALHARAASGLGPNVSADAGAAAGPLFIILLAYPVGFIHGWWALAASSARHLPAPPGTAVASDGGHDEDQPL